MPTTVDEYYNVLTAFRNNDPNGNGKKDEIPYFSRNKMINPLLQLWNAKSGLYIKDDGKTVAYGKTEEEYKNAIKQISKWYQEGLIDPEIFSRGSQAREQLLSTNVGGATHDWFSSTGAFNKYSDQIPGFSWIAIAPPADINGVVKEDVQRSPLRGSGWAISKDNKYPVETIKFFDWWFSDEGRTIYAYGIEGVDYTIVNGEPVFTDYAINQPNGVAMYLRDMGQLEIGAPMSNKAEIAAMTEQAKAGYTMYNDSDWYKNSLFPVLPYTNEEEKIFADKGTACTTLISEREQSWIMGTLDIDSTWDQYLADLKSMGYDEWLKAYQDAYERYLKTLEEISK